MCTTVNIPISPPPGILFDATALEQGDGKGLIGLDDLFHYIVPTKCIQYYGTYYLVRSVQEELIWAAGRNPRMRPRGLHESGERHGGSDRGQGLLRVRSAAVPHRRHRTGQRVRRKTRHEDAQMNFHSTGVLPGGMC